MRRFLAVLMLVCLVGCVATDEVFYQAVKANWDAVRPEYVEYVSEDADLEQMDKEMRMWTVEQFDRALDEHGKLLGLEEVADGD